MLEWTETDAGCRFGVKVQPNAKRTSIVGLHGERLKIALTAPAVDGKANAALVAFLADFFGVSKSSVIIDRGEKSREKTVSVTPLAPDVLRSRLGGLNVPLGPTPESHNEQKVNP